MTEGYAKRDRFLVWAANRLLRLTSDRYQRMAGGLVVYGMAAAARDQQEGRTLPPLPASAYPPDATPLDPS